MLSAYNIFIGIFFGENKLKLKLNEVLTELDKIEEDDLINGRKCYFKKDDIYHPEGECMHCDWRRQADAATGWDDPNFIEAWDYKEYWEKNIKKEIFQ